MKGLHDSPIGDFTRGGQTTLMMFRMIGEVLTRFGGALIIVYSCTTIFLFFHFTSDYQRYLLARYAVSAAETELLGDGDKTTVIMNPDKTFTNTTQRSVYAAPIMKENLRHSLYMWMWNMLASMILCLSVLLMIFGFMIRFGKRLTKEEHLRGARIMEADAATRFLKQEKINSDLRLAGVPMFKGKETSHVLATGAPGTGKTTVLLELMQKIRQRGDRVVCFSPSGDFIQWFYREKKDTILNPFDDRCPYWDMWAEIEHPTHADLIAAAFLPIPAEGDKFWTQAAQWLISDLIKRTDREQDRDYRTFLQLLSTVPLDQLQEYLNGTAAAVTMDPAVEKMALSIKTTAMTTLRVLEYIRPREELFRIRKWVLNDDSDQWVFLNARADQLATCRPLLSCWLELFVNAMLSLPESRERRIWLILDELPELDKQESLQKALAQGRKFGLCGVIAFQNIAQLRTIYGKDGAQALAGLPSTWICLRQNDPETAKWISEAFGECEVNEQNEGLSYGSHEMRDGVSLSAQRKTRPVLLASEILGLADLEGYIKMPSPAPGVHFKMPHMSAKAVAPAFIPTKIPLALPAPTPERVQVIEPDPDAPEPAAAEEAPHDAAAAAAPATAAPATATAPEGESPSEPPATLGDEGMLIAHPGTGETSEPSEAQADPRLAYTDATDHPFG